MKRVQDMESLFEMIERQKNIAKHLERIKNMEKSIDNSCPYYEPRQIRVDLRRKRQKELQNKIDKENFKLVERIAHSKKEKITLSARAIIKPVLSKKK